MAKEFKNTTNNVTILGAIKSHDLKKGIGTDNETKEKYNYINGKVTIKAGETREIDVKVYAKEFFKTKDGEQKENKKYQTFLGLINETYPTMAKVSEEEATKVSIWGNGNFTPQFKDNYYKGQDGEMIETLDIDLGMGNFTIKEPHQVTPDQYKAEFSVAVFVHDVIEELDKEEQPTGRAKITSFVPLYNGKVFPITLIAGKVVEADGTEYDFGRDVLDGVQPQDTVQFWGDIAFEKSEVRVKRGGENGRSIGGRDVFDTKTIRVKEFRVTAGSLFDDERAFLLEDIQEAVKQRKIDIENKKNEQKEEKSTRPSSGLGGASASMGAEKPKRAVPMF